MIADHDPFAPPPRQALLDYVTTARWFGGKGRAVELTGITTLPWLTAAGEWPAVRVEIVELGYRDAEGQSESDLYQLPMAYHPAPRPELQFAEVDRVEELELGAVVGYDAVFDPAARRLLIQLLLQDRRVDDPDSALSFQLTDGEPLREFMRSDQPAEVFGGQQSNTSIMYGDTAMLKLFRRLELGRNLDIEVHAGLSKDHLSDLAALYGWIEGSWQLDGVLVQADLAMVVERFTSAEDGWELALAALQSGDDFSDHARSLGQALAEVHRALAEHFPTDHAAGGDLAMIMNRRLEQAAAIVPALDSHRAGLQRCFAVLNDLDVATQRVHGDFHLGQTLLTPDGWKIIDFEGEPVKTLAERAVPDSGWRDVAGMLRSFGYAAASGAGASPTRASDWAAECRAAFLDGYGGDLPSEQQALLRAYEADKAIYEVVYEQRNRPDWVNIPLAAVAAIATEE